MADVQTTADLTAQAAALRAQADLAKARGELTAATTPTDPAITQAQAEKTRLDALKGVADSQKALADSQKEAAKSAAQATIGAVAAPANAPTGGITAKDGAGKAEATLLSAKAYRTAAKAIALAVGAEAANKTIVLIAGVDIPPYGAYQQFAVRLDALHLILKSAQALASQGEALANALAPAPAAAGAVGPASLGDGVQPSRPAGAADVIPIATAAGLALDLVSKLGAYFQTDYELGGLAIDRDREQLLAATAGELRNVLLPQRQLQTLARLLPIFSDLNDQVATAQARTLALADKTAKARAEGARETDAARQTAWSSAASGYDAAQASLTKALSKYDDFVNGLIAADPAGELAITRIMREKAVYDALSAPGRLALFVDVRAAVGAYYTKKNLWTFLGTMPYYAMGGAVVSFTLMDPTDGTVRASGLLPIHSGYRKVNEVEQLLTLET